MIDIKALRQIAEKATPEEWKVVENGNSIKSLAVVSVAYDGIPSIKICSGISPKTNNAEFIATANPQTVIALLDVVEAAKDLREKLRGSNGVSLEGRAKTITRVLEAFGAFDQAIAALEGE